MRNFREETLRVLHKHGLEWDDVLWAGTENYTVPLDALYKAMDINYDQGYGSQEIALDLIIVGANWWLERHEYDGSEWWELKSILQSLWQKDIRRILRYIEAMVVLYLNVMKGESINVYKLLAYCGSIHFWILS